MTSHMANSEPAQSSTYFQDVTSLIEGTTNQETTMSGHSPWPTPTPTMGNSDSSALDSFDLTNFQNFSYNNMSPQIGIDPNSTGLVQQNYAPPNVSYQESTLMPMSYPFNQGSNQFRLQQSALPNFDPRMMNIGGQSIVDIQRSETIKNMAHFSLTGTNETERSQVERLTKALEGSWAVFEDHELTLTNGGVSLPSVTPRHLKQQFLLTKINEIFPVAGGPTSCMYQIQGPRLERQAKLDICRAQDASKSRPQIVRQRRLRGCRLTVACPLLVRGSSSVSAQNYSSFALLHIFQQKVVEQRNVFQWYGLARWRFPLENKKDKVIKECCFFRTTPLRANQEVITDRGE
jgi:hypothetical protein